MRNIRLFQTASDFNSAYTGDEYIEPWFSYTRETSTIAFNKVPIPPSAMPLTFEILSSGNLVWLTDNGEGSPSGGNGKVIEYSLNGGPWTSISSSGEGTSIAVVSGDTVQFRGDNETYAESDDETGDAYYSRFALSTCDYNVLGNIMSLIDSVDFKYLTEMPSMTQNSFGTFSFFFGGWFDAETYDEVPNTHLISAENLVLPATALSENCYNSMFFYCANLTTAPELPATTLADGCYSDMFYYCVSLTTAPALPATALTNSCYSEMFYGCTGLTTAPELPATTLTNSCYNSMFWNCTNLNYIKCLAINKSATHCTYKWVDGVQTNSGTFVRNENSNWTIDDSDGIPSGWDVIPPIEPEPEIN